MHRRFTSIWHSLRSRPAGWLALAGQFVGILGLPVPAVSAKDLSRPFPCQHRQCGCMRADDCFTHCCCFSAKERVAWAEEHGIAPPAALVAEAAKAQMHSCCHKQQPDTKQQKAVGFAFGFQARQCKGLGTLWDHSTPGLADAPRTSWSYEWRLIGFNSPCDISEDGAEHAPSVPPPRD